MKKYLSSLLAALSISVGLPGVAVSAAPIMGRSNEGKSGTRKDRFGKTQRKWKGR